MGRAGAAGACRRAEAVGTRRTARPAADHAHAPGRSPLRQRTDRAPRRPERRPRQAPLPHRSGSAADGPARRTRRRHDGDRAGRLRSRNHRTDDRRARAYAGQSARCDRPEGRGEARGGGLKGSAMADKVVELRKTQDDQAFEPDLAPAQSAPPRSPRKRLRLNLAVVVPLIALGIGTYFYLASGRYISTDNAYVGAQKVLITPDISGKISRVLVAEGQRANAGAALFEIDPQPFRWGVTQAEARLAGVRTDFANLKTNLASTTRRLALARETVDLKQRDVERKTTLLANRTGSQMDMDNALNAVVTAKTQLEQLQQQEEGLRNQLLGNADLPIEQYPPYMQAAAVR